MTRDLRVQRGERVRTDDQGSDRATVTFSLSFVSFLGQAPDLAAMLHIGMARLNNADLRFCTPVKD